MLHTIVLILHVLGAGVVLGIVFLSVLAVLKPQLTAQHLDRLHFVGRFGMFASGWQFITGAILYLMEQDELKGNRVLWIKLGLYVVEGTFAAMVLNRELKRQHLEGEQTMPRGRLMMILSVHAILIFAIAALGVVVVEG